MRNFLLLISIAGLIGLFLSACGSEEPASTKKDKPSISNNSTHEEEQKDQSAEKKDESSDQEKEQEEKKPELTFTKPDVVRGIYVTGHSAGGERFETLLDLVGDSDLNAMVIDIKDDFGNITYEPDEKSLAPYGKPYIKDPKKMLKTLQKHDIYPIARIVVFKDSVFAEEKSDLSFLNGEQVWRNGRDEAFVSPFQKEVWEHNLAIAKEAAKMGFQEIQLDYVRFPEGFESLADQLTYDKGDYSDTADDVNARVQSVTDFVTYAQKELEPFDVDLSVDVFGYTVTVPNAPGIGQDIVKIGEHVDVLSSMIYPSHWGPGTLGIEKPDLEPYPLVHNYVVKEKEKLFQMDEPPTSRPWIQDFTASWLGSGNYKTYGKAEVEAQIKALNEAGIDEFLLWNATNTYTENVDYTPDLDKDVIQKIKEDDKALQNQVEQDEKEDKDTENQTEAEE